jgi:hypothetical protein
MGNPLRDSADDRANGARHASIAPSEPLAHSVAAM